MSAYTLLVLLAASRWHVSTRQSHVHVALSIYSRMDKLHGATWRRTLMSMRSWVVLPLHPLHTVAGLTCRLPPPLSILTTSYWARARQFLKESPLRESYSTCSIFRSSHRMWQKLLVGAASIICVWRQQPQQGRTTIDLPCCVQSVGKIGKGTLQYVQLNSLLHQLDCQFNCK